MTLAECRNMADTYNKSYPKKIDDVTTLNSTYCAKDGTRLVYAYKFTVDADPSDIKDKSMRGPMSEAFKSNAIQKLCTNKMTREALKLMDMRYEYFFINAKPFISYTVRNSDCDR